MNVFYRVSVYCFFLFFSIYILRVGTVTSLGWVSPGEATEGVTPIFSWKKTGDFFWSSPSLLVLQCHPCLFSPEKNWRPLLLITVTFYWFHSGVTPWRVSPGAVPPLATPLSTNIITIIVKGGTRDLRRFLCWRVLWRRDCLCPKTIPPSESQLVPVDLASHLWPISV